VHVERFGASCFWCLGTDFVQPSFVSQVEPPKNFVGIHSPSPVGNGAKLHHLLSSFSEHGSWLA